MLISSTDRFFGHLAKQKPTELVGFMFMEATLRILANL